MPSKTPPILIAALSARALAASAKRAGYRPLVVDCFGDTDLAAHRDDVRTLPASVRAGFDAQALLSSIEDLKAQCGDPCVSLVLGSGFEDRPGLVAKLANVCPLLGTDAETVQALKDPGIFFQLLDKLAIPHPEVRLDSPSETDGWVRKRIGGSGGEHIKTCSQTTPARRGRYFQRFVRGDAVSVLAIVSKRGTAFAVSRQWLSPSTSSPFRYGGGVSYITLPQHQERDVLEAALALTEAADIQGLASIDFLVNDTGIFCLEINPRPGASLDVHDDETGSLFQAHMLACQGGDPADHLSKNWRSAEAKAAGYLYADQGAVTIPHQDWPTWVHDRPPVNRRIAPGQPIASVHATAATADEAEQTCRARLASLEKMLYDS